METQPTSQENSHLSVSASRNAETQTSGTQTAVSEPPGISSEVHSGSRQELGPVAGRHNPSVPDTLYGASRSSSAKDSSVQLGLARGYLPAVPDTLYGASHTGSNALHENCSNVVNFQSTVAQDIVPSLGGSVRGWGDANASETTSGHFSHI